MKELSIRKNMIWNSTGSIFYLGCQWLITILVVRLSDDYVAAGALALGMAIANIFNPIGYYKIRTYQVSDLTGKYSSSDYIGFRVITTAVSLAAMLAYSIATCTVETIPSVIAYGLFSCGPVLVDVLHGIDQRHSRMDLIGISLIIRGAGSLIAFTAGMFFFNSLFSSLCLMVIISLLAIILYDVPATKRLENNLKPSFNRRAILSLAATCLPLVLALFLVNAAPSISRQLLAYLYSSSDLGIYASVAAPVAIVQMGAQYIYSPLLGKFAEYSLKNEGKLFISLLVKTIGAILLLTIALILFFLIFGEDLLSILYGNDISNFAYLLQPLILCTTITALVWFCGDLLIVIRKIRANLICYSVCFFGSIFTAPSLLIGCGLNGASYCLILGFTIGLIGSLGIIIKYCLRLEKTTED